MGAALLTGCGADSADISELDGASLAEVGGDLAASEIDVTTDPEVALENDSAEQWFIEEWSATPARESEVEISVGDELELTLESSLSRAAAECPNGEVGDEGASLAYDTLGNDEFGMVGPSFDDVVCAFDKLDMPDSIRDKVGNTRALDGTMSDEWDGIAATWSYHPDSGLFIVFELDS